MGFTNTLEQLARKTERPKAGNELAETNARRRHDASEMIAKGLSILEILTKTDNDYSAYSKAYREKVGVDLITDPYTASRAEIPITKTCSVIIPVFNNMERLARCLASIQASSFNAKYPGQLEVVIVDDGSTKVDIVNEVKRLGLADLKIKLVRQGNGQAAKARYSGVLHAKGDIVLFTDPDIIYTPNMIEEYMKRHEVSDNVVSFGLRENIDEEDARIQPDEIAKNDSLYKLPIEVGHDPRVRNDGMADSQWLKEGGNNEILPIDVGSSWHQWTAASIGWSLSISASRKDLLQVGGRYYEDYAKGYGGDDEDLVSRLMALGNYLVPNTGGFCFHQNHPQQSANRNVAALNNNLDSPMRLQTDSHIHKTDAKIAYEQPRQRIVPKEAKKYALDPMRDAVECLKMGLYDQSAEMFAGMEKENADDPWFCHDYALALLGTNKNNISNCTKGLGLMAVAMARLSENSSATLTFAQLLARRGLYDHAEEMYKKAFELDPNNEEAHFFLLSTEELHSKGRVFLAAGKPRTAAKYYDAAIAHAGGISNALWSGFDKAVCLLDMADTDSAIFLLEELKGALVDTWVYSKLGMAYSKSGQGKKARAAFKESLRLDAGNTEAQKGLEKLDL